MDEFDEILLMQNAQKTAALSASISQLAQHFQTPIASYVHTTNTEYVISAVDVTNNLFTTPTPHGLASGDVVFLTSNLLAGAIYPPDKFPGGLIAGTIYYVLANGLTSTQFKLSLSNGGSEVDITANANMDLTKFHFEKFSAELTFSNLPNLKRLRLHFKGKTLNWTNGAYIMPNGISPATEWFTSAANAISAPFINIVGDVYNEYDIWFDANGYLSIKVEGGRIRSNTVAAFTNSQINAFYFNPNVQDIVMTSISTIIFKMANGAMVEVFRA